MQQQLTMLQALVAAAELRMLLSLLSEAVHHAGAHCSCTAAAYRLPGCAATSGQARPAAGRASLSCPCLPEAFPVPFKVRIRACFARACLCEFVSPVSVHFQSPTQLGHALCCDGQAEPC